MCITSSHHVRCCDVRSVTHVFVTSCSLSPGGRESSVFLEQRLHNDTCAGEQWSYHPNSVSSIVQELEKPLEQVGSGVVC